MKSMKIWLLILGMTGVERLAYCQPNSVSIINEVWNSRQKASGSLVARIQNTRVDKKGAISEDLPPHVLRDYAVSGPIPPMDTTYQTNSTLTIRDGLFRYETVNRTWSLKKNQYVDEPYISTFDGKLGRVFHSWEKGESHPGDGSLRPARVMWDFRWASILPLVLYCRGNDNKMGLDMEGARLGGIQSIHGRRCVELNLETTAPSSQLKLWLDQDRGFAPLKFQSIANGKIVLSIDVEYAECPDLGIFPKRWTSVFSGNSSFKYSTMSEVMEYSLNNDVPRSLFDLTYPKDALVTDLRDGARHIATGDPYQFVDPDDLPFFRRYRSAILLGTLFAVATGLLGFRIKRRARHSL